MKRRRPKIGSVLQFELPDGRFAYGRVLRDASVAFYSSRTDSPRQPPLGERDYEFVVGVYDHVLRAADVPVVGDDPSLDDSDEWPPPYCVRDPISGAVSTYHHGAFHEFNGRGLSTVWASTKGNYYASVTSSSVFAGR